MRAIICLVVLIAAGLAQAQRLPMPTPPNVSNGRNTATITMQFDNRGSKTMKPSNDAKIRAALAKHVFLVPVERVTNVGGVGQSKVFNHQSVLIYQAMGPTSNGRSVLANCVANTKRGFFSRSTAAREIKKATDGWIPGDSLKLESASCK